MKSTLTLVALVVWKGAMVQMECLDRYLTDPLTYTNIVTSTDQVSMSCDLDFKPNSNELWVMNKGTNNGGSMVIVSTTGSLYKKHLMGFKIS